MSYTIQLTRRERKLLQRALTVWKRQLNDEPRGYENQDARELIKLRTKLIEEATLTPLEVSQCPE